MNRISLQFDRMEFFVREILDVYSNVEYVWVNVRDDQEFYELVQFDRLSYEFVRVLILTWQNFHRKSYEMSDVFLDKYLLLEKVH